MSEELALPTRESIMAAAKKCPQAKEVLEELFPKVFTEGCDYNVTEVERILTLIRRYVKGRDDDHTGHRHNRSRYFMAHLLLYCLYSGVVDEIEKEGPRSFYQKWDEIPEVGGKRWGK